jgi:hypothetical protein
MFFFALKESTILFFERLPPISYNYNHISAVEEEVVYCRQCCGSEFFSSRITDLNFFYPGSRIRIKEFKYFNPKICF